MNEDFVEQLKGRFIVFDGPDGSGKTTQFSRLLQLAKSHGLEVCEVREPGGTAISEKIRDLLLDPENEEMTVNCEMLLYMASRAQMMEQRVAPLLQAGNLVLADRFISSTLAYQGHAGGMSEKAILDVGHIAIGEDWPDLVIIFDVDEATAAKRLNPLLDRMEQKGAEYHRKVREGYLKQAKEHPKHYRVIDARPDQETVYQNMCEIITDWLAGEK